MPGRVEWPIPTYGPASPWYRPYHSKRLTNFIHWIHVTADIRRVALYLVLCPVSIFLVVVGGARRSRTELDLVELSGLRLAHVGGESR